jgi:hypothetical protein
MMEKKKNSRNERVVNKVTENYNTRNAMRHCAQQHRFHDQPIPGVSGKIFNMYMTKSVADYITRFVRKTPPSCWPYRPVHRDKTNRVGMRAAIILPVFRKLMASLLGIPQQQNLYQVEIEKPKSLTYSDYSRSELG